MASLAVAVAASGVASASAEMTTARVHWGRAELMPGVAALNKGYNARVNALSCWSAGDCVAGGFYTDRRHHSQAWLAVERKGRWSDAAEAPGTASLNAGGNAQVGYVSCARTSVCVAVGTYTDNAGSGRWFTAGERDGRWGKAAPVPVPALADASINTVWCAAGGLCAAGGSFTDSTGTGQAWMMTQKAGRWQQALEVPGIAALNVPGGNAVVNAISCSSPGNCAAGGIYDLTTNRGVEYGISSGFVVTQASGAWGTAEEVPGLASINPGWDGYVSLISCPSAGNCAVAGYTATATVANPCGGPTYCITSFVAAEHDGSWGNALVAGLDYNDTLTCVGANDCVAGGAFFPQVYDGDNTQAGAKSEANGNWGPTVGLKPLLPAPNSPTGVAAVSCSSAGNCAAVGQTLAGKTFVASEWDGAWGAGITPAGITSAEGGTASAVACPPKVELCVAGGFLYGPKGGQRAFLVSQIR